MAFPQNEICEVTVGGGRYSQWETAMIRYEVGMADGACELTTAEFDPMPSQGGWGVYRIKPGDPITITLAGELAFTGWCNLRQAAYDANSHGVMIHGRGKTQKWIDGSVVHDTMQFKNQSLSAILAAIQPPDAPFQLRGPDHTFEDVQVHVGETKFNFIERLTRPLGLYLNTDVNGTFIVSDGSGGGGGGMLVEGVNILRANCTIRNDNLAEQYIGVSQNQGTQQHWGPEVAQIMHVIEGTSGDPSRVGVTHLFTAERAMDQQLLKGRVGFEGNWRDASTIEAEIVVYGWKKDGGGLWKIEEQVTVNSPMLMLNGESLWIRAVTFTQDSENGSITTLDLTNNLSSSTFQPSGGDGGTSP